MTIARATVAALVGGLIASTACSRTMIKQGGTSLEEFTVACPRDRVFDEALAIAQHRNLEVKVLEKSSGFIRFERSTLGPLDLDTYCTFPVVDGRDGMPLASYHEWVVNYGEAAVGTVTLNLLLTAPSPDQTRVSIRGNWTASLTNDGVPVTTVVDSTGALENEIRDDLASGACAAPLSPSTESKLEQLRALRDRGLITDREYNAKRIELQRAEE